MSISGVCVWLIVLLDTANSTYMLLVSISHGTGLVTSCFVTNFSPLPRQWLMSCVRVRHYNSSLHCFHLLSSPYTYVSNLNSQVSITVQLTLIVHSANYEKKPPTARIIYHIAKRSFLPNSLRRSPTVWCWINGTARCNDGSLTVACRWVEEPQGGDV